MVEGTYGSLSGKAVVVTGGASGIGEELVRRFVEHGAKVGFIDKCEQAGWSLERMLSDSLTPPVFLPLDLTNLSEIEPAVSGLIARLGGADVLVNNAANDERHILSEITPSYWHDRMAVNLDHFVFMIKSVVPAMEAAGCGVILNMGSCSWRLGLGGMTAYVTAKAAIEGLTNGLARELGQKRIRVNCVIPGFVRTPRQVERWLTPKFEEAVFNGQCLPDFIGPRDVANLVTFLASDQARMCTSGSYTVDGGWI